MNTMTFGGEGKVNIVNVRQATACWEMLLVFVSVGAFVDRTAAADPTATPGVNAPFAIRGTGVTAMPHGRISGLLR